MAIRLNSAVWGSIFAVPTSIVDEHIKKAGGQQIKVILYLLRHQTEELDAKAISRGTGIDVDDVKDAFVYWKEAGLIYEDGETPIKMKASEEKVLKALPDVAPTYDQVAARTLEDANLRALFNEVQLKLGRTIGYNDQAQLLMMLDYYGLPVEVILTIVEYCVSKEKSSLSYMAKVAKTWAELEINTLERADAYLKELKSDERLWKKFVSMFSHDAPNYTDARFALLKKWHVDYKQSIELIFYAYEVMIESIDKVSFSYLDKILENWKIAGVKKPQDAMKLNKDRKDNLSGSKPKASTSYDVDKVKQSAQAPIEYKRKERN